MLFRGVYLLTSSWNLTACSWLIFQWNEAYWIPNKVGEMFASCISACIKNMSCLLSDCSGLDGYNRGGSRSIWSSIQGCVAVLQSSAILGVTNVSLCCCSVCSRCSVMWSSGLHGSTKAVQLIYFLLEKQDEFSFSLLAGDEDVKNDP